METSPSSPHPRDRPAPRRRDSQIFPAPEGAERDAILAAVEQLLREEDRRLQPSAWKIAGRASGRRLGITGARHRLGRRSWSQSARIGWASEAPQDLRGRGDAS